MPPIPVGHALLKFRFVLVGDAEEMITTLGVETTAASTSERIAAANSAMDSWGDNMLPIQSNTYTLVGVDAVFGTATGDVPITSTDPARVGAVGGAVTPPNTAMLVKKVSGQGGRRNRGRMYVPGISQLTIDHVGGIAPATLATYDTAVNNLLLGIESGSFMDRLVIFHSIAPLTPTIVEDLQVDPRIATQRRRLRP
jgi:hypothetical protein